MDSYRFGYNTRGLLSKNCRTTVRVFYITYPPAFIFTIAIIILLFIVLKLSIEITGLIAKTQDMTSELSILKLELNKNKELLEQHKFDHKEQNREVI